LESTRELPAHNIRGLALSARGDRLLVAHQMLGRLARSTREDVHWGNLMTNNLRSLVLADILDPKADLLRGSSLDYLGEVGHGTGDPAGLAVAPDGTVVATLAGIGEVAVGDKPAGPWRYPAVGRRPTAVAVTADGRHGYVANTFGDSISVV